MAGRASAAESHTVNSEQIRDLLRGTYRVRTRASERVDVIDTLQVTLASDFIVLRRRAVG